jgi:hypothetical protein
MKFLKNDLTTLLLRISILYVILFITQVLFYLYNREILGTITFSEGIRLFQGSLKFNTISILYLNGGLFCILSLIPFRFRANKIYQKSLFWLFIVSNSLAIVVLNLMDIEYFRFTQKRLTSEEFHFLDNNTNNLAIILTAIKNRFELFIIGVLLIWGMIWTYRKIPYRATEIKKGIWYYPICTIIFCISIYVMINGIRGSFSPAVRPYTLSNAVYYCDDPRKTNLILSNPFCILRTIEQSIDKPVFFDDEELLSIFSPNHQTSEFAHNLGKRNIVIFILECFSKEHSKFLSPETYPDHPGFTPFLDSLMQDGFTFFNAFSSGQKSIDALPSILASIPSYRMPFVLLPQSLGEIQAMPYLLSNEGYHTAFFCGAERNSMGFEAIAKLTGIRDLYTREDYRSAGFPINSNTDEIWGIYDEPFFEYMSAVINQMPEPFFSTVFTLTSHHPYTLPKTYQIPNIQHWTPLHPTVTYTDNAVRRFFELSKNEPWFENTIFVFVADHAASVPFTAEYSNPRDNSAIFQFFYTPDKTLKGHRYQTSQQLDLMPTLLGLIGYEKPFFAFGRDVFNQPDRLPLATNFVGQTYQGITDSITIYFDGEQVVSTHNNVQNPVQQAIAERHLKAILQTYYQRLHERNYLYR